MNKAKQKIYLYIYTSQSLWQMEYLTLSVFFLTFFFQQMGQVWVSHSVHNLGQKKNKIWNLIFGWTRHKIRINHSTELKKSVAQNVLLCPSYLFLYILTAKFIKIGEKNVSKKKKNIQAWILLNQTHTAKQCAWQLWDRSFFFFFFSLIKDLLSNWTGQWIDQIPIKHCTFKAWSNFQNRVLWLYLKNHHSRDVDLKFQSKWSSCLDVWSSFANCSYQFLTV